MNLKRDDGILESLAVELYPNNLKSQRNFPRFINIIIPSLFSLLAFFSYFFVFIKNDWMVFSVLGRVITLSFVIILILVLSHERMEWRLISAISITLIISIDIMAQIMGYYEHLTSFENGIKYDFLSHIFTGAFSIFIFSNIIRNTDKKILWVIISAFILGILWEIAEYGLYQISELLLNNDLNQFTFDLENTATDLIAHAIGVGIITFLYVVYKYFMCPKKYRQGFVCKLQ